MLLTHCRIDYVVSRATLEPTGSTKRSTSPATGGEPPTTKPPAQSGITATPNSRDVHKEIGHIDVGAPRCTHRHTHKHIQRGRDAGSSVWEKSVFLIQPQQGIKSTLCWCAAGRFAGLDRSLESRERRIQPLYQRRQNRHVYILQVLNMSLLLLIWSIFS